MAKLIYADIIEQTIKYKALADLSLPLSYLETYKIMTTLVDLLDDTFIPLLAEKWSVTGYDGEFLAESEGAKRELIKVAIELHRHKGTPWAIREVFRRLGFGEVEIDEGLKARVYENSVVANIRPENRWAYYSVRLTQPITNEQSASLRKILRNFAPARCTLAVLDYKAAPIRYNRKATYNRQYNYGSS